MAMVTGLPFDVVADRFPDRATQGVGEQEMVDYLAEMGIASIAALTWPCTAQHGPVPAILTVPSMNHPGLLHFVAWDGEKILDPTHEALRYPDDQPLEIKNNGWLVPWASAILLWQPSGNPGKLEDNQ